MRRILQQQIPIVHLHVEHEHGFELAVMGHVLDKEPQVVQIVFEDLTKHGIRTDTGRDAMTAEQVLRSIIVKQMNGYSYKELAFHLADSRSYRTFCRFGINDKAPSKATLQRNIKKISAETMEAVNQIIVHRARKEGIESGRKARVDCTGVETNIHHPSDSSLLWDCVRVLTRNLHLAKELVGFTFMDHCRRAKRRYIGIRNAKKKNRVKMYRDLLKVTRETVLSAELAVEALKNNDIVDVNEYLAALGLAKELEETVELAYQVINQTQRRVLNGESVPSSEKIVSIFEPHTDIIKKDKGDPLYGHKLCLTTGASGIVTDCVIEDGNPSDSTLAVKMMERHKSLYGQPARQASFDGGFASRPNLYAIKEMGVEDVVFAKKRSLKISDMARSCWVYKRIRNFRAGIEGVISFLKRCFGLGRCTWRGLASFKAYAWSSIVSVNLLLIARHMLS